MRGLLRGDVPEERNDGERHPACHPDIRDCRHPVVKSRGKDRRCTVRVSGLGGGNEGAYGVPLEILRAYPTPKEPPAMTPKTEMTIAAYISAVIRKNGNGQTGGSEEGLTG